MPKQKNPVVAFTLSLFVWGGGQFYNRDWKLGILLVLLMVNFWAFLGAALLSWRFLSTASNTYLSSSNLLFAGWVFSFFALLIWFSGALQAYRKTDKGRETPFTGVEKRLLPPLCSFFIPGWGQFLNGQFRKGALFIIASVLSFSAIPSILVLFLLWPTLDQSPIKSILEWNFAVSLMIVPFFFLIWLVGIFDAFKVSFDEVKKESWLRRISYARNRVRLQGWRNTVFKRAKILVSLSLLLVLAVLAGSNFLPANYYEASARQISAKLSEREMVIVPQMIDRFLEENSLTRE